MMWTKANRPHGGFSLIEMIGVLAVLSILAATLIPNVLRRVVQARGIKEERQLVLLADGLMEWARSRQVIPGGESWVTNLAEATGLNAREVERVNPWDSQTARVFLVHPGFTPSTGWDPVCTNLVDGLTAPRDARVMILSSSKPSLPLPLVSGKAENTANHRQAFERIWDWNYDPSTQAAPAGWPSQWTGMGAYLHVARINLAPLLHHVTFSNLHFPTNIPLARIDVLPTRAFDLTNAVDAWYWEGTRIRLFKHDSPYLGVPVDPDQLDILHSLLSDQNFIYQGTPAGWLIP